MQSSDSGSRQLDEAFELPDADGVAHFALGLVLDEVAELSHHPSGGSLAACRT